MQKIKQPNQVRGNQIKCINFQMCPMCYGCRAYNSLDPDCQICKSEGEGTKRNFNICNTDLHESWKINHLVTRNKVIIKEEVTFKNGGIK